MLVEVDRGRRTGHSFAKAKEDKWDRSGDRAHDAPCGQRHFCTCTKRLHALSPARPSLSSSHHPADHTPCTLLPPLALHPAKLLSLL